MMRLDAALRVDGTCDTLRASDGGAMHTWTIPHGLYFTPEDIAAELQSWAVADIDAGATVTVVDGSLVLSWPGDIVIEWTRPRLRDWLGFDADVDQASPATAPHVCRGTFIASLPWSAPSPLSWHVDLARAPTWRGSGRSALRAIHRQWSITARVTLSELAQLRLVLASMLSGMPAKLSLDVANANPFGSTDPYGYVKAWLSPSSRDYVERWLSLPARVACEIDLTLSEYVTP